MNNISALGKKCCGCAACEQVCPKHCIQMKPDEEGFLYPVIDTESCVDCGVCVKRCPVLSLKPVGNTPKVFSVKSKDTEMLQKCSSGGVFPLLALQTIRSGGTVFGCAYDKSLRARHTAARTESELEAMFGSKYVQSDTRGVYTEVKDELQKGVPVLFSGTSCQVAGLVSFLGRDYDNLLTVDVLCHGVPSPLLFKRHMEYLGKKLGGEVKNFTFRCKDKGWGVFYRVETADIKKVEHSHFDPYFSAFVEGKTVRESCYSCVCATPDRHADITLADFWGIDDIDPKFFDKNGVSLVLVNTPKGDKAMNGLSSDIISKPQKFEDAVKKNSNLIKPTKRPACRDTIYQGMDGNYEEYVKTKLKIKSVLKKRIKMLVSFDTKRKIKQLIKHRG